MTLLAEGTKAPDFNTPDQNGKMISLKDFRGKKVVLYFYPKDDTPGCTAEACNLRDNYSDLTKKGIAVLGVSVDDEKSHKKFEEKFQLPFTLLADTDKKIVNAYGVWGEKKMMGRTYDGIHRVTYLIDEEGMIAHVIQKVETKDSTKQILETWGIA